MRNRFLRVTAYSLQITVDQGVDVELKETFTRNEVAKMLETLAGLVRERDMSFDALSETVLDESGGFVMDSLLDCDL